MIDWTAIIITVALTLWVPITILAIAAADHYFP